MEIEILKNIEGKILFLGFGKHDFTGTEFDIELRFSKLKETTTYDKVGNIEILKAITKEVITIKAPYGAIGYFNQFDIFQNGKIVGRMENYSPEKEIFITPKNIEYFKPGQAQPFILNPSNQVELALFNQNLAYFKLAFIVKKNIGGEIHEQEMVKYFVFPCSEIYNVCYGNFDRAVIDATFTGIPEYLYNKDQTNEYRKTHDTKNYIRLTKHFLQEDTLAPFLVYRLFEDEDFFKSYNKSRHHIIQKEEYFYSEFPPDYRTNLKVLYIKINDQINYVTQITSLSSGYPYPKPLRYDTDNSQGELVTSNTIRVAGVKTIKPPVKAPNGINVVDKPQNPSIERVIIKKREFNNPDIDSELIKIQKQEKKTTNEDASIVIQNPDSLTMQHGSNGSSTSAQVSNTPSDPNSSKVKEITLDDLEQIRIKLSKIKEIKNLQYYLDKSSHSLEYNESKENDKVSKWIYLTKDRLETRSIGILELSYNDKLFYILDVEKRNIKIKKNDEENKEGICLFSFYMNGNEKLDVVNFGTLKRNVVKHKGQYTKVLTDSKANLPIKGEKFIHGANASDRIFEKIKEWGKKTY